MYRQSRRKASLTERARRYLCPGGVHSDGARAGYPVFFTDHWWEVRSLHRRVYSELTFGGPRRGCGSLGTASRSLMSLIDTDATARYARL